MGFLHAPIRKRQPRDPVARGNSLRHAWTPFVGGYGPGGLGLFDAAPIHAHGVMGTGSPTTTTGTYHCATRFGQAIRFDDSGTGTTASKRLPLGNTSGNGAPSGSIFTIHALVAVGSTATNNAIYATNSSNGGIRFGVDTSAKLTLIKPGTAVMGSSTGTLTAGQFYSVGVTYDGATVSFYINGQQSGTASSSQTFTHEQANAGSDVTDSAWNITNSSYLVLLDVWDRALTPRQMFERFSDPWSIYTQPGRIYINAAAGGGGAVNGVGQADGVATVTAGAFATHNVAGTSAGTATVTAGAAAIHNVVGTSAGTASVAGTLITGNEKDTVGQADGVATVTAVGAAVHYVSGTSAGLGDATGSVAIVKNTVGQSDGLSTVTGDGQAVIGGQGVGQADGIATVSGTAAIVKNAVGTSAGASSADGVNPQTVVTQTLTIVGAGGAEEKDWRDHVRELNARNSGLRKKLASKKKELKRLEKKIKTVEVEYKTGKTEGILANLYRLEMQKEEVKNEIKAVEVDLTGLILVLQKVEIEEDDADFFSLQ